MTVLDGLSVPVVQAPMAGGPSTPELAAAVNRGGGLGFVAAGYLTPERLREQLLRTAALTDRPFGVNLFTGSDTPGDADAVAAYGRRLGDMARRAGVELGEPRFDDDWFAEKVALLIDDSVPGLTVVSFTFGLPPTDVALALRAAGLELWMTVTSVDEARAATEAGADALIVQGIEAGGHRGVFVDDDAQSQLTLLSALQLIARGGLAAAGRRRSDHDRVGTRGGAGRRRDGRAARHRVSAQPGGRDLGCPARRDRRYGADGADASVQRPDRSRDRQPLARRARRRRTRGPTPRCTT